MHTMRSQLINICPTSDGIAGRGHQIRMSCDGVNITRDDLHDEHMCNIFPIWTQPAHFRYFDEYGVNRVDTASYENMRREAAMAIVWNRRGWMKRRLLIVTMTLLLSSSWTGPT